jgi:molybdopterin-guanine dinucleotide biosynthesis protein B
LTPVVSFVGNSGVGKTTFLEKLIPVLKERGYRIAAIKHDVHRFEVDYPGKDSWRLTQAGGDVVLLASAEKLAMIERLDEERTLTQLVAMVEDRVDLVLTEGYRGASAAKIEVSRRACGSKLTARLDDLIALVTDQAFSLPVPSFGLEDASAIADFIEARFGLVNSHEHPRGLPRPIGAESE